MLNLRSAHWGWLGNKHNVTKPQNLRQSRRLLRTSTHRFITPTNMKPQRGIFVPTDNNRKQTGGPGCCPLIISPSSSVWRFPFSFYWARNWTTPIWKLFHSFRLGKKMLNSNRHILMKRYTSCYVSAFFSSLITDTHWQHFIFIAWKQNTIFQHCFQTIKSMFLFTSAWFHQTEMSIKYEIFQMSAVSFYQLCLLEIKCIYN